MPDSLSRGRRSPQRSRGRARSWRRRRWGSFLPGTGGALRRRPGNPSAGAPSAPRLLGPARGFQTWRGQEARRRAGGRSSSRGAVALRLGWEQALPEVPGAFCLRLSPATRERCPPELAESRGRSVRRLSLPSRGRPKHAQRERLFARREPAVTEGRVPRMSSFPARLRRKRRERRSLCLPGG